MQKPILVIMAAGLGSRYGGLKQIDPVGPNGEMIIDYSIYDAVRAGFERVVFIIKEENREDFEEAIGVRASKLLDVKYAYQKLTDIPEGCEIPKNRVKPWGTTHAVLSARHLIDAPFVAINADDYYGVKAFSLMYTFLTNLHGESGKYPFCMMGYELKNTLTDFGSVARGVCKVDSNGFLSEINERTNIVKNGDGAFYTDSEGNKVALDMDSTVSMNMWGFTPDFFAEAAEGLKKFLTVDIPKNPEKAEYYLPLIVEDLVESQKATIKVLRTPDRWHGVTYKEDKPSVSAALAELHKKGIYPNLLSEK